MWGTDEVEPLLLQLVHYDLEGLVAHEANLLLLTLLVECI